MAAAGCLVVTAAAPATSFAQEQSAVAAGATAVIPSAHVTPSSVAAPTAGTAASTATEASGDSAPGGDGYRFWSFWLQEDGEGAWEYAAQGPGTLRPSDGAAIGFRFGLSAGSGEEGEPRTDPSFDTVCSEPDAGDEQRMALVLDFGTDRDAPAGTEPPEPRTVCADIPDGGTVADVLAAEADPLRYDSAGLLCAIDGYPAEGCGEPTGAAGSNGTDDSGTDGETSANGEADSASTGDSGFSGLWLGVAAVAVLALAAVGRSWRRGRA